MKPSIRLRRQFQKRASDPMAHLMMRAGVYHYNRRVPEAVLAVAPRTSPNLRRSTGTDNRREAQAIAREWAAIHEAQWIALVEAGPDAGPWLAWLDESDDESDRGSVAAHAIHDAIDRRIDALGLRNAVEHGASLPKALMDDPIAGAAIKALRKRGGESVSWAEAWEAFEGRSGLKLNTRRAYAAACATFDREALPAPHRCSREDVRNFLRASGQRVKRSTITSYIAAATAILNDLYDSTDPRSGMFKGHTIRVTAKATRKDAWDKQTLASLFAHAQGSIPLCLYMLLLLYTGARRDELYSGVVDIRRKVLTVPESIAKTAGSAREIPIPTKALPLFEQWLALPKKPKPPVIAATLVKARRAAGLPDTLTLHSCRHAYITALTRLGVPREAREALTGHAPSSVHGGYVHLGPEDLRRHIEELDWDIAGP